MTIFASLLLNILSAKSWTADLSFPAACVDSQNSEFAIQVGDIRARGSCRNSFLVWGSLLTRVQLQVRLWGYCLKCCCPQNSEWSCEMKRLSIDSSLVDSSKESNNEMNVCFSVCKLYRMLIERVRRNKLHGNESLLFRLCQNILVAQQRCRKSWSFILTVLASPWSKWPDSTFVSIFFFS